MAVPLFVYEGPCLRPSVPERRVESPPEPSPSPFWPRASQADPGSQGSPPALPASSWCIRLRGRTGRTGRTGRWGGGREEVRGLPGRVKEVTENEEAPRSGRQMRLRRREERGGGAGDPRCSSTAPRTRPPRAGSPRLDPALPRPRLTCAGRSGLRSVLSASRDAAPGSPLGREASGECGRAPPWRVSRCLGSAGRDTPGLRPL